jgi:drug/metabolite transporter (DMT)-like permease
LGETLIIPLMNPTRWLGVILVAAGVLGLVFGGFSYTKDETAAKIGPLELSVKEKETVNIPMWAGVGAVIAGTVLLIVKKK